jgi:hypothetical protein
MFFLFSFLILDLLKKGQSLTPSASDLVRATGRNLFRERSLSLPKLAHLFTFLLYLCRYHLFLSFHHLPPSLLSPSLSFLTLTILFTFLLYLCRRLGPWERGVPILLV